MIRPGKEYKSLISEAAIPWLSDSSRCEDLSAVDGSALTEMLVTRSSSSGTRARSTGTAGATTLSAPFHTKILSKTLSGSRRCTMVGSRSSPESKAVQEARVKIVPRV